MNSATERALTENASRLALINARITHPGDLTTAQLRRQTERIEARARRLVESAEAEGRGLNDAETREFGELERILDYNLRDLRSREESGEQGAPGRVRAGLDSDGGWDQEEGDGVRNESRSSPGVEEWRDGRGTAVRVYRPEVRLADHTRGQRGLDAGTYMRAVVMGPRTPEEQRALQEGTDSAGGYTVPEPVSAQLIDLMRAANRVTQAGAKTVVLDSWRQSIARVVSDPATQWLGEGQTITPSEPSFAVLQFEAKTCACIVKISRQLWEDSVNMESVLPGLLASAMASEVDRISLYGTGADQQPLGLTLSPGVGVVSMGTNGAQITNHDPLLDARQLLLDANVEGPTAAILAPRTETALAKLKDSTGQPLARPQALASLPMLATTKVPTDEAHGTANNASRIILGDFRRLVLGYRMGGVRLELLRERFADSLEYALLAHVRLDVAVEHPASFVQILGITP